MGAIIQTIDLMKERFISAWQAKGIIIGLLLLNNPGFYSCKAGYEPVRIFF